MNAILNKLEALSAQLDELDRQLADPKINSDHTQVTALSRRRATLEPLVSQYRDYQATQTEIKEYQGLADVSDDDELIAMARDELPRLKERAESLLEKLKGDLVTSDDAAIGSIILEIRAGVGGDEAGIWAGDLFEMYQTYVRSKRWKWEVMSFSPNEMGGYRDVIVHLEGAGVWQHLGYEGGTHCVKRVPSTETQGRIHTSTATVAVLPEPEDVEIHIDESEVEIDITTSQGPGGQNVNKVATAVKLRHLPTGIEVRMQDTKSQHQNRALAWQLLRARLYEHEQNKINAARAEQRSKMIGHGDRSERIRTYRYKDNLCVDHRLGESFNLQSILAGDLDPLLHALIEHDKTQRLANL